MVQLESGCSLPGKQAWFVVYKVYQYLSQSAARKPSSDCSASNSLALMVLSMISIMFEGVA